MQVASDAPKRPALRYHGSKWLLAPWVLSFVPKSHELYAIPYGGGAGTLLRKERSYLEMYNDLDGDVVNYFRVLRDDPDRLIRMIELTPYSYAEWQKSFEPDPDPMEAARRFYIRSYMSIAGPTAQWNTGWRRQKVLSRGANGDKKMTPAPISFMRTDHLYDIANRLRGVQIECAGALSVIERYDTPQTFFYLDPPYVMETRGRWREKAYRHEMSDGDHEALAGVLIRINGMAVISGYACKLYKRLYERRGWRRVDRKSRVNGPGHAIESLWLSPRTVEALEVEKEKSERESLPLLAYGGSL